MDICKEFVTTKIIVVGDFGSFYFDIVSFDACQVW
jgi:hypothetical protein